MEALANAFMGMIFLTLFSKGSLCPNSWKSVRASPIFLTFSILHQWLTHKVEQERAWQCFHLVQLFLLTEQHSRHTTKHKSHHTSTAHRCSGLPPSGAPCLAPDQASRVQLNCPAQSSMLHTGSGDNHGAGSCARGQKLQNGAEGRGSGDREGSGTRDQTPWGTTDLRQSSTTKQFWWMFVLVLRTEPARFHLLLWKLTDSFSELKNSALWQLRWD